MLEKKLTGKNAFVTGSGRGIGRAIADYLASLGANIIVHDLFMDSSSYFGEGESIAAVSGEIAKTYSVKTMYVIGDLTKPDVVRGLVQEIHEKFGHIDILVNNAGADINSQGEMGPNAGKLESSNIAVEISDIDIKTIFERNVLTCINVCKTIAPGMMERQNGKIVNIGSTVGSGASPEQAIYSTAKAAVHQYTRCLAGMMRKYGVMVNVVAPGPTLTKRYFASHKVDQSLVRQTGSFDRYAWPLDIAKVVGALVSDEITFVTGQVIRVDGGRQLFPS